MAVRINAYEMVLDIQHFPEVPLAGEPVRFKIDGNGPHHDVVHHRQLWVQTNMGEPTATFKYRPGNFALAQPETPNIAPGRDFIHAYENAGDYDLITETNTWLSGIVQQRHSLTVKSPDDHAFTHEVYADLSANPSTADMPPETDIIKHATTQQQLSALIDNVHADDDELRIHFRGGVTHTITLDGTDADGKFAELNARRTYINTFGSQEAAIIDVVSSAGFIDASRLFDANRDNSVVTMCNIEVLGHYDIVQGRYEGSMVTILNMIGRSNVTLGLWRVKGHGCDMLARGSNPEFSGNSILMQDCHGSSNHNFNLTFSNGLKAMIVRGCKASMPLNSPRGDTKPQPYREDNFADHSTTRAQDHEITAMLQNDVVCVVGWSPWPGDDKAIQPNFRLYYDQIPANGTPPRISVLWNRTQARSMVALGGSTPGALPLPQVVPEILIVGNYHVFPCQGVALIDANKGGGVTAYSNVGLIPNLPAGQVNSQHSIMTQYGRHHTDNNGVILTHSNDTVWGAPNYISHNTYVSDMSDGYSFPNANMLAWDVNTNDDNVASVVENGNLFSADNYAVPHTPSAHLSRGDSFRPIAGLIATSAPTDPPPISFDRVRGGYAAIDGAHARTGPAVAATAPSWSADPVIDHVTGAADTLHVNIVSVQNIDGLNSTGLTSLATIWNVDGVPMPYETRERFKNTQLLTFFNTGEQLSVTCIATNESGVRAERTSNVMVVP